MKKTGDSNVAGTVKTIWTLYLVAIAFQPIALIGVVMAYVNRSDVSEKDWEHSHFIFQIRTFWIGLIFFLVWNAIGLGLLFAIVTYVEPSPTAGAPVLPPPFPLVAIGCFLMFFAALVWYIVRCIKGLNAHGKQEHVAKPFALLW